MQLKEYIRLIRKRMWLIGSIVLLVCTVVGIKMYILPRRFMKLPQSSLSTRRHDRIVQVSLITV